MDNKQEEYKLIRLVDPTKVKLGIREKFTKLTLSSNKKKKEVKPQIDNRVEKEKRQSASRNLMETLSVTYNEGYDENVRNETYANRILQSSSSSKLNTSRISCEASPREEQSFLQSEVMEPLELSESVGSDNQHSSIHEISHIVSTESQRLSIPLTQRRRSLQKTNLIVTNPPDEELGTSGDETASAITISDTSVSDCKESDLDYDRVTSNISQSAQKLQSEEYFLDVDECGKADHMQAFLKDVSQERRNRPKTISDKELACADTESMSTQANDFYISEAAAISEREKRLLALDDTASMSQARSSIFVEETTNNPNQNESVKNLDGYNRQLAQNETEPNTMNSSTISDSKEDTSISFVHNSMRIPTVLHEDSVVISETSDEEDQHVDRSPPSLQTSTDKDIVVSEPLSTCDDDTSEMSQIQVQLGKINISAKINIKIHIPEQEFFDDVDSASDDAPSDEENLCSQRPGKAISWTEQDKADEEEQANDNGDIKENDEEDVDENFMVHAEKLLNQLYGCSWKTPDVIRTLKRSSASGENKRSPNATSQLRKYTDESTPFIARNRTRKCSDRSNCSKPIEESHLDDFSIFRQDVNKSNWNSTRLVTPQSQHIRKSNKDNNRKIVSESRPNTGFQRRLDEDDNFKKPQSEIKPKRAAAIANRNRWRQLLIDDNDDDQDGDNAIDDDSVEKTDSDFSYHTSSDSDNDVERKKAFRKRQQNIKTKSQQSGNNKSKANTDKLIYLDLSHDEVVVQEGTPMTAPANNDENFDRRLQDILRTCKREDKPKLESTTPQNIKSKRKLFTINFGYEGEEEADTPNRRILSPAIEREQQQQIIDDLENIHINGRQFPAKYDIFNKQLESIKTGKPIFKLTPPRNVPAVKTCGSASEPRKKLDPSTPKTHAATTTTTTTPKTPTTSRAKKDTSSWGKFCVTPNYKYGFLKSLDVCVSKTFCHPDALCYRDNYRLKKEELTKILYDLFNEKLFNNDLNVTFVWNKKLLNTAGRCLNKKKMGIRTSSIELSEKVLTSADRLRCTLIHELCHAATWVFDGEQGHGAKWKEWARRANAVFPELPKIGVCHNYDIEYKYTYKCTLCAAKSHAHSKSKKVENIRCSYCHGAIEIFLNKKDKYGNIMPTPVKEPTGFAKFVKDNYKQFKRPDLKHADVMKLLSNEFAALKVAGNTNEKF